MILFFLSPLPCHEWVSRIKKSDRKIESEPEPNGDESESNLVTDGGTEAKRDLERVREARDGDGSSQGAEVELYTCPIDGCSRTVVGELANLRHHVRQTTDEAHDGLALNGDLEVVELNDESEETESDSDSDSLVTPDIDEEAYHSQWGPGNHTESNKPTVNSAARVTW